MRERTRRRMHTLADKHVHPPTGMHARSHAEVQCECAVFKHRHVPRKRGSATHVLVLGGVPAHAPSVGLVVQPLTSLVRSPLRGLTGRMPRA